MAKKVSGNFTDNKSNTFSFDGISSAFISVILFFLPLVITNGYYNITATKYYFYLFASAVFILSFLVFAVLQFKNIKKLNFKIEFDKNFMLSDLAFWGFFVISIVSALLSDYGEDVWTGKGSRYQGVITLFIYLAVYFIVSRNFPKNINFLFFAICAFDIVSFIALLNCFSFDVLGVYEHLTDGQMAAYVSTVGNINFYSSYICLLLPLTLCGFCQSEEKFSKIFYGSSLVVGTLGMMVTSSESFVIGFLFSIAVVPLFLFKDIIKLKKFLISVIIIIVTSQCFNLIYNIARDKANVEISALLSLFLKPYVAFALLILCVILLFVLNRGTLRISLIRNIYCVLFIAAVVSVVAFFILVNTVLYDIDFGALEGFIKITPDWGTERGRIWIHCVETFKDFSLKEKLFGVGPEALYHLTTGVFEKRLDQAHCEYLQYLMTVGIFGVVSYLALIVSVVFAIVKKLSDNPLAVGLFAGLVSYWVQATVNIAQPFTTPIMYIYIACIGGLYYNCIKNRLYNIIKVLSV